MTQTNPMPNKPPNSEKLPPKRECGARSTDYGSYGYPCELDVGHKGPHRTIDKDDCPHYYEKAINE